MHNIGTDGIIYNIGNKLKEANAEEFHEYMEHHYLTCEDGSVIKTSGHGLWIGRKR